jgi:hypothetical protein
MAALRFLMSIEPSNRVNAKFSLLKATSIRSRKPVNWEKTTARNIGSWSLIRPTYPVNTSVERYHQERTHEDSELARPVLLTIENRSCEGLALQL